MKKSTISLLILVSLLFTAGCAIRPYAMIPDDVNIAQKYDCSVAIRVINSDENSISFEEALTDSIVKFGLFSRVAEYNGVDYLLEVVIAKCTSPFMGLDFTISLKTEWKIIDLKTNKIIWNDTITKSHTTKLSEAISGYERRQFAIEGAARAVISTGIERIATLNLDK